MTEREARETLPDVYVKIKDKVYHGWTSGSHERYATVLVDAPTPFTIECTWPLIVRSINQGFNIIW
jgi:hypothetical protein